MILVFEIGGSSIRAGTYDGQARRIHSEARAVTPSFVIDPVASTQALLARLGEALAALAATLAGSEPIEAIGIGYPGPVSPEGIALSSPTILGAELDEPVDVAALMRRHLPPARLLVINDVTACGYRYVADGQRDFCLVNVGSGVGNKLFVDGRAVVGPSGRGGEMGHFLIDPRPDAPICQCGARGHLAGIASGRGTLAHVQRCAAADRPALRAALGIDDPALLSTADIVAAYRAGNPWIAARIGETAAPLARAIAGMHATTGVECFILVGGFALALGEPYRALLARCCAEASWNLGQDWDAMLSLGEAGDNDGLIGLGYAALTIG